MRQSRCSHEKKIGRNMLVKRRCYIYKASAPRLNIDVCVKIVPITVLVI